MGKKERMHARTKQHRWNFKAYAFNCRMNRGYSTVDVSFTGAEKKNLP